MNSINMSKIEQDSRIKSMTTLQIKESQSNKSVMADQNSRDISYFNEKHIKPNKIQVDREFMRDFFKEEIETFELPTQLHQLES